jgi:hypothetical protein
MYLTGATRPAIGFAINMLARYVANPGKNHWRALVHLLRYLKGTLDEGVHYCGYRTQGFILEHERRTGFRQSADDLPNPKLMSESFRNNLVAFADADWANDVETRRSVTGWVVFLNGGPVSWRVKRQQTVATSSSESELYSLGDCIKELLYLRALMKDMGILGPDEEAPRLVPCRLRTLVLWYLRTTRVVFKSHRKRLFTRGRSMSTYNGILSWRRWKLARFQSSQLGRPTRSRIYSPRVYPGLSWGNCAIR